MNGVAFPPRSDRVSEIETLLGMLDSVVPHRAAVYVAAPITSGRRFIDWFPMRPAGLGVGTAAYLAEHQRHVVEPNCRAAAAEVARLRGALSGVVIDPTAVTLNGWSQADYHALWGSVIERFARAVVFLDGWEYSGGCVYEFFTTLRTGAATLTATLTPLGRAAGTGAIQRAVATMRERGIPSDFFEAILHELTNLREPTGTP